MKYNFSRIAIYGAATATAMGLGFAPVASAGSLGLTGPGSYNSISYDSDFNYSKQSTNNVDVSNNTSQNARSGDAYGGGYGGYWGDYGYGNKHHKKDRGHDKKERECNDNRHKRYGQWNSWYQQHYWKKYEKMYGQYEKDCDDKHEDKKYGHGYGGNHGKDYGYGHKKDYGHDKKYGYNKGYNKYGHNDKKDYGDKKHHNYGKGGYGSGYDKKNYGYGGGNTYGGHAKTGDADNYAKTNTDVQLVNNSHTPKYQKNHDYDKWGGFGVTGPGSYNEFRYESDVNYSIQNDNSVNVDNNTQQNAESGDAYVSGNTYGGSAITGDATNRATTSTSVTIRNQ